jgi:hypothetical protein
LAVGGDTSMIDDPFVVSGFSLVCAGGTQTIDDSTLTVDSGTLTSDAQHRLDSAITSTT